VVAIPRRAGTSDYLTRWAGSGRTTHLHKNADGEFLHGGFFMSEPGSTRALMPVPKAFATSRRFPKHFICIGCNRFADNRIDCTRPIVLRVYVPRTHPRFPRSQPGAGCGTHNGDCRDRPIALSYASKPAQFRIRAVLLGIDCPFCPCGPLSTLSSWRESVRSSHAQISRDSSLRRAVLHRTSARFPDNGTIVIHRSTTTPPLRG
jgi:hypothetical protein